MPRVKQDNYGNLWLCLGQRQATSRDTYGPEFGHEQRDMPPSPEQHYDAAKSYADAVDVAPAMDRVILEIKRRQAQRLYAVLQERGCDFRVEDGQPFVRPAEKVEADERKLLALLRAEMIELIGEGSFERFESSTPVAVIADKP